MTDDAPDCPDCESDVFVSAQSEAKARYRCHACGLTFTTSPETPPEEIGDPEDTVWVSTSSSRVYHASKECKHGGESVSRRTKATMDAWGYSACSHCHGKNPVEGETPQNPGGGITRFEREHQA